ncbi:MAG: hypothetical protein QOE22_594 [Candidatus Parcubacteria bacterium]|jgi:hypothetical protein|nr:hypothetical protein [Candidatus Parcubacteria bacterium]
MPYLISILVAGALFLAFLLLTAYEARRGSRFFATFRYRLDSKVSRAQFLVEHIDWGALTAHLTRTSLNTVAHDAAHGTLIGVRAVERNLTRAVSVLRTRRENTAPPPRIATAGEDAPRSAPDVLLSQRAHTMGDIVRKEGEG